MKKLFLILAAAVLLVACKKENGNEPVNPDPKPQQQDTVVDNPLYNQVMQIMPLVESQKSTFESEMKKIGFEKAEGTETYIKITDNTFSEVTYVANSSDNVYSISCAIRPYAKADVKYEPTMTINYIKDIIKKIGGNCELGVNKINCVFNGSYNQLEQRILFVVGDFQTYFNENNMNGSTTVYLDSQIQNWIFGEPNPPFVGMQMSIHDANQMEGSNAKEFKLAFTFANMSKADPN